MSEDFREADVTEIYSPKAVIEIYSNPTTSYALQASGVSLVRSVTITNVSAEALEGIMLVINTDPAFMVRYETHIETIQPGESYVIDAPELLMSHDFLSHNVEGLEGSLSAILYDNGEEIGRLTVKATLLDYAEWPGVSRMPQTLAAFILPNAPEVEDILKKAAALLKSLSNNADIMGYQAQDKSHVNNILFAIYSVIKDLNIAYSNPPASFETLGQKVRFPERMISKKLGTCLDLTLLFAACIEQAGLNPLVFITPGHAFVGAWLVDESMPRPVSDEVQYVKSRLDLKDICAIETTLATGGKNIPFTEATATAGNTIRNYDPWLITLDIKLIRAEVKPLSISISPDAYETEHENGASPREALPDFTDEEYIEAEAAKHGNPIPEDRNSRLERWKKRLLDTTKHNMLINFIPKRKKVIGVIVPDLELVEDSLAEDARFKLEPLPDPDLKSAPYGATPSIEEEATLTPELVDLYFKRNVIYTTLRASETKDRLNAIYREYIQSLEESGTNTLYMALGFLKWYESETSVEACLAPIVLVPINIIRKSMSEGYQIERGDDTTHVNFTLFEMLERDYRIKLPDPKSFEGEEGFRVKTALNSIKKAISRHKGWEVIDDAYIAHLSFKKHVMWKDLQERIDQLEKNAIVKHLINEPDKRFPESASFIEERTLDEKISPTDAYCVLSYDSSQLSAILAAGEKKSFILHGPPGTGKSQTIANMISHCLAIGRRVLFVAEKKVALEVVMKRLVESGLGDFCLELHSNKVRKADVLAQLGKSLEARSDVNTGLWKKKADDLGRERTKLNNHVESLHKVRANGESFFDALSELIRLKNVPSVALKLKDNVLNSPEALRSARDAAEKLASICAAVGDPKTNIWRHATITKWDIAIENELRIKLNEALESITHLEAKTQDIAGLFIGSPSDWSEEQLAGISKVFELLKDKAIHLPQSLLAMDSFSDKEKSLSSLIDSGKKRDDCRKRTYASIEKGAVLLDQVLLKQTLEEPIDGWALGFLPKEDGVQNKTEVLSDLAKSEAALKYISDESTKLSSLLSILMPEIGIPQDKATLGNYLYIIGIFFCLKEVYPLVSSKIFGAAGKPEIKDLINECIFLGQMLIGSKGFVSSRYTDAVFKINHQELRDRLEKASKAFFLTKYFELSAIRKVLASSAKPGTKIRNADLASDLANLKSISENEVFLKSKEPEMKSLVGKSWPGIYGDWMAFEDAFRWSQAAHKFISKIFEDDITSGLQYKDAFSLRLSDDVREGVDCLLKGHESEIRATDEKSRGMNEQIEWLKTRMALSESSDWGSSSGLKLTSIPEVAKSWLDQVILMKNFISLLTANEVSSAQKLASIANDTRETIRLDALVSKRNEEGAVCFNGYWSNGQPDWEELSSFVGTMRELTQYADMFASKDGLPPGAITTKWAKLMSENKPDMLHQIFAGYNDAFNRFNEKKLDVSAVLGIKRDGKKETEANHVSRVRDAMQAWLDDLPGFKTWYDWKALADEAKKLHIGELADDFRTGRIRADQVLDCLNRSYYEALVGKIINEDENIKVLSGSSIDDAVRKFRLLDDECITLAKQQVYANIAASLPDGSDVYANGSSEMGILKRELAKQKRHMPIRKLVSKIPNLLPRLKPCLLMSPLSVAQYLDPNHPPFDVVIFDEASQIPTWDAIGAIARGEKAIIVGDPNQLPPTNFFMKSDDALLEYDERGAEDLESILDECSGAQLPERKLNWHYRSRNESLIAFSNRAFYGDKLFTFPSAESTPAVTLKYINGKYGRRNTRANKEEAEAIVKETIRRLHDKELSKRSIGIVTFSIGQQAVIEKMLDDVRMEDPLVDEFFSQDLQEPIFVKNLENVQGDERDVMMLSVCYGPDDTGKVAMNFGPLNKDGGHRRLNVAITRAKHELIVFSSLHPQQMDMSRSKSKGVASLKEFLEYAERMSSDSRSMQSETINCKCNSYLEEDIKKALEDAGYKVRTQVGMSGYRIDLAILDGTKPDKYILGIECDGKNYSSGASARDRDKLRNEVLKGLGWQMHKVWSANWWRDPKGELTKIEKAVKAAQSSMTARNLENEKQNSQNEAIEIISQRNKSLLNDESGKLRTLLGLSVIKESKGYSSQSSAKASLELSISDHDAETVLDCTNGTRCSYPEEMIINRIIDGDLYSSGYLVKEALTRVVQHYSPISLKEAVRLVISHWGMKKVTDKSSSYVASLMDKNKVKQVKSNGTIFLWRAGENPSDYKIFRTGNESTECPRSISDIPPEEIANALLYKLRNLVSSSKDTLISSTAKEFGIMRAGELVASHIEAVLNDLIKRTLIRKDTNGMISLQ